MMRLLLILSILVVCGSTASAQNWLDTYDNLLQKYVTPGGVKYKSWHDNAADMKTLAEVVDHIAKQSLDGMTQDAKLAFYLNAYNAWILHTILSDYPTKGPGGGGLFGRNKYFKAKSRTVAGKTTSFHLLENEIIRPNFQEPRIHFALNCASKSCPPLHTRAFRDSSLDSTLDTLTRRFVNDNPNALLVKDSGKTVEVSKIFDWYDVDFEGGVIAYMNKYREEKLDTNAKVRYQKYHWTLNESH